MPRQRHRYGPRRGQHGDLWLPDRRAPAGWPVVVLIHGGFWRAMYTKHLMTALAADVIDRGWAAWNIEYRRLGTLPSGGWPATFEDVAAAVDHVRILAGSHPLDLDRVVTVGHSAGGHLALWAGARRRLPDGAPGAPGPGWAAPRAVIGLAAVADLEAAAAGAVGGGVVPRLVGGPPRSVPDRYRMASPVALLPYGLPQVLVHGSRDATVPVSQSRRFVQAATAAGDDATLVELAEAGHMELIDPASAAWGATVSQLRQFLG